MCHYGVDPKEISNKSILHSPFFISDYNMYAIDVRGVQYKFAIRYTVQGTTTANIKIQHTRI